LAAATAAVRHNWLVTSPLPPIDYEAASDLWAAYVAANPKAVLFEEQPPVEQFGDRAELIDELLDRVVTGTKRAAAGLAATFAQDGDPLPRIGSHWIAADSSGKPRVVVRSVSLRLGRLDSVEAAFAHDEGEGEQSRESWLADHRDYFHRTCERRGLLFTEDQDVLFERFAVVWPPELAG